MDEFISRFTSLPGYGIAAIVLMLLYAIQSEIRFGARARAYRSGAADRMSTAFISIAAAVPIIGLVFAMRASSGLPVPPLFHHTPMPGMPAVAWVGVALGFAGLALRLWAVLTLRERYTRTLLVHDEHDVENGGPYRWVRHPGYLGSLMCLNGIGLASGNWIALLASLGATGAAYAYRIKVEDEMLVAAFGPSYDEYRRRVRALLPLPRR